MHLHVWLSFLVVSAGVAMADDDQPVFRSDVSLGRIDVLVTDRTQHPIRGLRKDDFFLRQDGKPIPIREVASEDQPLDVLLLLDVSGSMRVHIQKVASAAHGALAFLGDQDRVGIMVFTTYSRVELPFRQDLDGVERALDFVVQKEPFNGGTNINGALLDAAGYVERNGRPHMRRAIVIVTDDQALPCDPPRVSSALDRADAVLMVLLAPAMAPGAPYPVGVGRRGGQPPVFTTPFPGGGIGGPLGGIVLGRRRPAPGTPFPGSAPVMIGRNAGSPDIARASGGDALDVDDASAVETTFERLRRRYAVFYYLPNGIDAQRALELDLTNTARRKHPDAALQYRQVTLAKDGAKPGLITRVPAHPPLGRDPESVNTEASEASSRRKSGASDRTGPQGPASAQSAAEPLSAPDASITKAATRRRGVSDTSGASPVIIVHPQ